MPKTKNIFLDLKVDFIIYNIYFFAKIELKTIFSIKNICFKEFI